MERVLTLTAKTRFPSTWYALEVQKEDNMKQNGRKQLLEFNWKNLIGNLSFCVVIFQTSQAFFQVRSSDNG